MTSNCALLAVFAECWDECGAERRECGIGRFRPIVRDTQTIHRASTPPCSLRLFAGRYGATGALQLLRDPTGHRPFTAVTRVQIPSGTPNLFKRLRGMAAFGAGTKRHNSVANFLNRFTQLRVFSGIRSCFCRHKKAHATQPDQAAATAGARNRRMTLL